MDLRFAEPTELDALAQLWHAGWHDAHAPIVPAALTRVRTLASFRDRLGPALATVRIAGPPGAPVGFCLLKGDELNQLYVAAHARGAGVAAALIADAEARLHADGVEVAWLACAIGNDRAARFYSKSGWSRARTFLSVLETPEGPFALEVWRFEKRLTR